MTITIIFLIDSGEQSIHILYLSAANLLLQVKILQKIVPT